MEGIVQYARGLHPLNNLNNVALPNLTGGGGYSYFNMHVAMDASALAYPTLEAECIFQHARGWPRF